MTKGKIIVVEGTDCSGKKTQSEMLAERLTSEGEKSYYFSINLLHCLNFYQVMSTFCNYDNSIKIK